jgi:DNA-binding Lrp family transcriptional regulator
MKVITANMNTYQDFIMNKLSKLDMIATVNSQFVLKNVKFRTDIKV